MSIESELDDVYVIRSVIMADIHQNHGLVHEFEAVYCLSLPLE